MRSVRSFAVRATVLLTTVALVCSTANAVLTTYSDRSLFLAALPGAAEFESFEDEALEEAIHDIHRKGFKLEKHEVTLHGHCADCK